MDVFFDENQIPRAEIVEIAQPTPSGEKTSAIIPSIVAYYEGNEWIGEGAREVRNLSYDPSRKIIRNRTLFYETKNEIGTSRKYKGQNGIESPVDVATKILKFICDRGIESDQMDDVVVTVPASFQSKQRDDTMRACNLAGLNINGHRLLDEPCAAFIDYASRLEKTLLNCDEVKRLLVFDFGGGTCDIAIFELSKKEIENNFIDFKSLSVSRYHRLGGGDIDLAIIHKVLIPALIRENNLTQYEIDFDEQQAILVPALTSVAEALKTQISNEIWRLKEFKQYEKQGQNVTAKFPAITRIKSIRLKKELTLSPNSTILTIAQFEEVLEPFLTTVQLTPHLKEERIECSIFTPIEDALDRANLKYDDIDYVFVVGGSALIPQIVETIEINFPKSDLITYKNRKDFQFAIARGAALQAWSLAKYDHGFVRPVIQDDLYLSTENGEIPLIEKGSPLPFPINGWKTINTIAVPQDAIERELNIAFNFVAGAERRLIGCGEMNGIFGVPKGTRIELKYQFDENQVFHVHAKLLEFEESTELKISIENPISNVVNPNAQIEERDRLIEKMNKDSSNWKKDLPNLARLCANLGFYKQAISYLRKYQKHCDVPSCWALNSQANYEDNRGNLTGAIECYKTAAKVDKSDGAPCFNLALLFKNNKNYSEALSWVDEALKREKDPAYKVLRLQILEKLKTEINLINEADIIIDEFGDISSLGDWQLGWLRSLSNIANNTQLKTQITEEQEKRNTPEELPNLGGVLPIMIDED